MFSGANNYWWRSWFRHSATSLEVAGSIPGGVIGDFHCHNSSGRTMALGSTEPLPEISARYAPGRKGVIANLPHSWANFRKSGSLNILEPLGPVQACAGIVLFYRYV
jgi:hypothetical protein